MATPRILQKKTERPAKRGYRSRTDTINLIYAKLYEVSSPQGKTDRDLGWRSANEIAKEILKRKGKYPVLWEILDHLVRVKWIEEKWGVADNGRDVRLFRAIKYNAANERLY